MKIEVDTVQSEYMFGDVRELRGNFETITKEDDEGNAITHYRCDAYRTNDPEKTFAQLHDEHLGQEQFESAKLDAIAGQAYLDETDYRVIKATEMSSDLDVLYPGEHSRREDAREKVRAFQDLGGQL